VAAGSAKATTITATHKNIFEPNKTTTNADNDEAKNKW